METLAVQVTLSSKHAQMLKDLLVISPDYVSDLLTLKLTRAEIYAGMKGEDDGR